MMFLMSRLAVRARGHEPRRLYASDPAMPSRPTSRRAMAAARRSRSLVDAPADRGPDVRAGSLDADIGRIHLDQRAARRRRRRDDRRRRLLRLGRTYIEVADVDLHHLAGDEGDGMLAAVIAEDGRLPDRRGLVGSVAQFGNDGISPGAQFHFERPAIQEAEGDSFDTLRYPALSPHGA